MKNLASPKLIEDLLLFDPVTERGQERLRSLGLHGRITPEQFFNPKNKFWVNPTDIIEASHDTEISYDPTPDARRIESIKARRKEFYGRFHPNLKRKAGREFTLLMGVVGAGKSVELQRQLYSYYGQIPYRYGKNPNNFATKTVQNAIESQMSFNAVYLDMERVNTEIPIGQGYDCDINNPLDLFFTKLLATLIYYIKFLFINHRERLIQAAGNLELRFNNHDPAVQTSSLEKYISCVTCIQNYANNQAKLPDVLKTILSTVENEIRQSKKLFDEQTTAEKESRENKKNQRLVVGIKTVLHILGFIMIGVNPDQGKCIVVDNVEDLIKVNDQTQINISLSAAREIYLALLKYAENIRDIYDDAGLTGSFHIVMALRRTTWDNLQTEFAGNFAPLLDDMFDITGDIAITDLWNEKAYPTWKNHFENDYDGEAKLYIDEVNKLMTADEADRNSIQQRSSRLMSNGLRRQGHSLSKALYNMFYNSRYGIFKGLDNLYIKKSDYDTLFDETIPLQNLEAKYLRKSAAAEFYLMEQFTSTGNLSDQKVGGRWRSLDIGKITNEEKKPKKYYSFAGERKPSGAEYPFTRWDFQFCSESQNIIPSGFMLRQLLRALADAPEAERASRCAAPLYETVSLRTVIRNVLQVSDGDAIEASKLLKLTEIILAGARPDTQGEFSPLYLFENGIDIKDTIAF